MGDVEVRSVRAARSIYRVHYALPREPVPRPLLLPTDRPLAYQQQVAGHTHSDDTKYLGLLQFPNGTILKPIIKESQKRELEFYERLNNSQDPDLMELRKFTPKYYGCKKFSYNGYEQDYIILEDLTERMLEPCIMDIKIGKRTWDPLATVDKIKSEQTKYALCKQEYGFCIPGYQVYKLATGKLHKYNKDYGKKLHGNMVREAIRNFLNAGGGGVVCRALVLQILSALWAVQQWSGRRRALRLYSSSVLLVYDAAKLRAADSARNATLNGHENFSYGERKIPRRRSIHSMHSIATTPGSNFSGQISSKGPVYKKVNSVPLSPMNSAQAFAPPPAIRSPWSEALDNFHHNHSFEHNYEDKLSKIKMNYRAILEQLSCDTPTPNPWGTVKIIDFAHAFFNSEDEATVDPNFYEGICNLVHIFESFLAETDDQVF